MRLKSNLQHWKLYFAIPFIIGCSACPAAETKRPQEATQYAQWIAQMKSAERGPFARIRWFCKDGQILPRLCEKSRAIVKLDIFSKTLRTFVVLSGIALTGPKCGTLCARTIARIASNLTR